MGSNGTTGKIREIACNQMYTFDHSGASEEPTVEGRGIVGGSVESCMCTGQNLVYSNGRQNVEIVC